MKTLLILLAMEMAAFGEPHVWTTTNGNRFPGEFYSAGQEKVVITVKISDLSDVDKKYIASQKTITQSTAPQNQAIRILSVLDAYGLCKTSIGQIYLMSVPASVGDYLVKYSQLKSGIPDAEANVEQKRRDAARADANAATGAAGDAYYVNSVMALRIQAENMHVDADNAASDLKKIKKQLAEMETGLIQNTTVMAYSTGKQYSGFPLWQCVGIAPSAQTTSQ